jgi:hypothetical protein
MRKKTNLGSNNKADRSTGQKLNLQNINRRQSFGSMSATSPYPLMHHSPMSIDSVHGMFGPRTTAADNLPFYIKPLPSRIGIDEIDYLDKKGALSVPRPGLRLCYDCRERKQQSWSDQLDPLSSGHVRRICFCRHVTSSQRRLCFSQRSQEGLFPEDESKFKLHVCAGNG